MRRVIAVAVLGALLAGCRSGRSPEVDIGARSAVLARLARGAPLEFGKGRHAFYVVAFPQASVAAALASYPVDLRATLGVLALSALSPHLAERVLWCRSSGWFESPAHGEKFSRVGERTEGPAPRGMDLYPIRLREDGHLVVNTRTVLTGVPSGTSTVDPTARGPRCVN